MRILILVIGAMLGVAFLPVKREQRREDATYKGEKLHYKINYSFFNIGKANVSIDRSTLEHQGRECYAVRIKGETSGIVGALSKVNDEWGAYVGVSDLRPYHSYRRIREGKYRKDEEVSFDHESGTVKVRTYDFNREVFNKPKTYNSRHQIFDLLSGMLQFRSLDFSRYKKGDKISINTFFEDQFYDFNVHFAGTDYVRTRFGKLKAYKLVPIMPENKIFDGEDSITVWLSADENQIPLKVKAEMFIGSVGCELTSFENLKYPITTN